MTYQQEAKLLQYLQRIALALEKLSAALEKPENMQRAEGEGEHESVH